MKGIIKADFSVSKTQNLNERLKLLIVEFLNSDLNRLKSEGLKPIGKGSLRTYRAALDQFRVFVEGEGIQTITPKTVADFKEYLGSRVKPRTAVSYQNALRRFMRVLVKAGLLEENIAEYVTLPKVERTYVKDSLSEEEFRKLLDTIHVELDEAKTLSLGSHDVILRDFALLNLLLRTGIRTIEAVRADIGDIEVVTIQGETQYHLKIQGKGKESKDDYVVLFPKCYGALSAYLTRRSRDPAEPLFISYSNRNRGGRLTTSMIRRITGGWFEKAGIVKEVVDNAGNKIRREISAHSLRHTAAMLSLEKNVPINDIQSMLRHKDLNTTFLYLKRANRTKAKAEKSLDEI